MKLRLIYILVLIPMLPASSLAQQARESLLNRQSFNGRVNNTIEGFKKRHDARKIEIQRFEASAASDPSIRTLVTIRELDEKQQDLKDLAQTLRQLEYVYSSQVQKIKTSLAEEADDESQRKARIDHAAAELAYIQAQIPEVETAIGNLCRLDASGKVNELVQEASQQLNSLQESQAKNEAMKQSLAEEYQAAQSDIANLDKASQALQEMLRKIGDSYLKTEHSIAIVADRGRFLIRHAKVQNLLDDSGQGLEKVASLPEIPSVEVLLPGIEGAGTAPQRLVDVEKLRGCILSGGKVEVCERPGGTK